ncbi:hypothetical protein COCSADRAFT_70945, partial [Bipolaris sorokiniana ND90Pr]
TINQDQIKFQRGTAKVYEVSRTTLQRRCTGMLTQRDCRPNSKKLTKVEEEVIVNYFNLDLRRFLPTYAAVRNIANRLLTTRSA